MITVVICSYNPNLEYLTATLESLNKQIDKNFKTIIVDDGSTVNKSELSELANKYGAKLHVNETNLGLGLARNVGISLVDTEEVLILDDDDLLTPYTIDLVNEEFKVGAEVVVYNSILFDGQTGFTNVAGEWNMDLLLHSNQFHSCIAYKKYCAEQVGGYTDNAIVGYEDWDFAIKLAEKDFKLNKIPYCLFAYRIKPNSLVKEIDKNKQHWINQLNKFHWERVGKE